MRIVIKDVDNNQTVLCDGPERGLDRNQGPLTGITANSRIVIQPAQRFRADFLKHFNRLNRSSSRQLRVVREMQSMQAAELWQLQCEAQTIRDGTIEFAESDGVGNVFKFALLNAAIPEIAFVPMGVSREIIYTIVGGGLIIL